MGIVIDIIDLLCLSLAILTTLKMDKDTTKLKKNIALMCERIINKGASLSKPNTTMKGGGGSERERKLSSHQEEEYDQGKEK